MLHTAIRPKPTEHSAEQAIATAQRAIATAGSTADLPESELDRLEATLLAAEAIWERDADLTDEVKAANEGREVTPEDEAAWSAASDAHWEAVDALVEYRPRSADELVRKAELLTNRGDTRLRAEEQFADIYLGDAKALAALAQREPPRDAWDQAVAGYRNAIRDLDLMCDEEEDQLVAENVGQAAIDELQDHLRVAYAAKDATSDLLLAMDPPDAGGLLVQMEIICDRSALLNVSSYEVRDRLAGALPLTVAALEDGPEPHRGLALIAMNAAKLRDRLISPSWREVLDASGACHPNFRDSVRSAIDAGFDPSNLESILLAGGPDHRRPALLFGMTNGTRARAEPKGIWPLENRQ